MGRGKKSNRNYITRGEWINDFQGKKAASANEKVKGLPFYYCALILQPFVNAACIPGDPTYLFEFEAIVDYIKENKVHPITGEKVKLKAIKKLNFTKNENGNYECPILNKEFTDKTHIVAIGTTGNVYSWEAVDELNLKRKNFKDLITDEPFTRKDIITIQNPDILPKIPWNEFYHVKEKNKKNSELIPQKDPNFKEISIKNEGGFTCVGFDAAEKVPEKECDKKITDPPTEIGYVSIVTNFGRLNIELYVSKAPKTCLNFITLCKSNYYENTIFHRNIKDFMLQGGDPTGTGRGGASCWGDPFFDEFHKDLTHSKRGILSMANAGPNTNKSQFFITYKATPWLNKKHSVFGSVVGGLDLLTKFEAIETDKNDKPKEEIKILKTEIYKDPFAEQEAKRLAKLEQTKNKQPENLVFGKWYSNPQSNQQAAASEGVGRYIQVQPESKKRKELDFGKVESETPAKKRIKTVTQ